MSVGGISEVQVRVGYLKCESRDVMWPCTIVQGVSFRDTTRPPVRGLETKQTSVIEAYRGFSSLPGCFEHGNERPASRDGEGSPTAT